LLSEVEKNTIVGINRVLALSPENRNFDLASYLQNMANTPITTKNYLAKSLNIFLQAPWPMSPIYV